MKLVLLSGGLGNQMFIYAFCLELRSRGHKVALIIDHNNKSITRHHGYILEEVFFIKKYDSICSWIYENIYYLLFHRFDIVPYRVKQSFLWATKTKLFKVKGNFIYYPEVFDSKFKNELFIGTWQSEKYFSRAFNEVRKAFDFNLNKISEKTIELMQLISQSDSVSIHIRRGDYQSEKWYKGFGLVCNDKYYSDATNFIKKNVENPKFFLFSDDPQWVSENYRIENSIIVNHNNGADSWQDLFLISRCKHNIVANSTFSWWGAWLNSNQSKIVIAPKRWWSDVERDDVVPDNWIRF